MISAHLVSKFTKHTEFVMKNRCTLHLEHNFGNTSCKIITPLSKSVYPNVTLKLQTCSYNKVYMYRQLHIDWTILTSANPLFIASISIMKITKNIQIQVHANPCLQLRSTCILLVADRTTHYHFVISKCTKSARVQQHCDTYTGYGDKNFIINTLMFIHSPF